MRKKKITINDIADRAGVSTATVSRILNKKDVVKPETERHVWEVISELEEEYGSDTAFSRKRNSPDHSTILLIAELDSPVLNNFAAGIQKVTLNRGYHIIILDYTKHRVDLLSEINCLAKNIPFSGIIMLNNYESTEDIDSLTNRFPVVTAYTASESTKYSSITTDDRAAGRTIANHLLSLGCKDIVFLALNDSFVFSRLRVQGVCEALKSSGIELPKDNLIYLPSLDFGVASSLISQRLSSGPKPDAIIGVNDALAAVCIREARHAGYNVPDDILIAGFDNAEISTLVVPNLTTIDQSSYNIGVQTANMLLQAIENPNHQIQHILLRGELLVRESSTKSN